MSIAINSGGWRGLGAVIPISSVATDTQAAAALAQAQTASGLPGMPASMPVGVINSGGFSVLVILGPAGSQYQYGYDLAGAVPSAALLTSLGLSATQTSFNNAQTVAILNAMQGASTGGSVPGKCSFNLGTSDTSACVTIGSQTISSYALAAGAAAVVLLFLFMRSK